MTRPPDLLRFLDVPERGRFVGPPMRGPHEVIWTGPWPPPARMTLAVGQESGIVKVLDREELDAALLAELEQAPTIDLLEYTLRNASRLPDDFETELVFRGAEYVRADDPERG